MKIKDGIGVLKTAGLVALSNGVARWFEGGVFWKPAAQSALISAVVLYSMADFDDFMKSGAVGVGMAASCKVLQNAQWKTCAKYGLVSTVATYLAIGTMATELSLDWRKLISKQKDEENPTPPPVQLI